jgi:hypothetical protein
VENPGDAPTRYNVLRGGDFALFEFSGTVIPSVTKVVLVASGVAEDATMFAELRGLRQSAAGSAGPKSLGLGRPLVPGRC